LADQTLADQRGFGTLNDADFATEATEGTKKLLDSTVDAPTNLRSQIVTSNPEPSRLRSRNVTLKSGRGQHRKYAPYAFTEQGVAMLSSVLKSPMAVRVNIEIMRTFVRVRRLMATPGELVEQLTKLAETVQLHDDQIQVINQVLQQMLSTPPAPRRAIGFHAKGEGEKGGV
jgi:hypothetical protein